MENQGARLTLAHSLISGNIASTGREIFNDVTYGTVIANNHNLFGVNGNAGVAGFTPGPTESYLPQGSSSATSSIPS